MFDNHLVLDTKVSLRETRLISDYQHRIERIFVSFLLAKLPTTQVL